MTIALIDRPRLAREGIKDFIREHMEELHIEADLVTPEKDACAQNPIPGNPRLAFVAINNAKDVSPLRKIAHFNPNTALAVISCNPEYGVEAIRCGVTHYLMEPVAGEDLIKALREYLSETNIRLTPYRSDIVFEGGFPGADTIFLCLASMYDIEVGRKLRQIYPGMLLVTLLETEDYFMESANLLAGQFLMLPLKRDKVFLVLERCGFGHELGSQRPPALNRVVVERPKRKYKMKIISVSTVESDNVLRIEMDSGDVITLDIKLLLSKPGSAPLEEDNRVLKPHTGGDCLYWPGKPMISLSLTEIADMLDKPQLKEAPANARGRWTK